MSGPSVYDWNEQARIALVEPGAYVQLDSFDVANLTPIRECYLRQYHYVASAIVNGLCVIGRRDIPGRWHGGIRPWETEEGGVA